MQISRGAGILNYTNRREIVILMIGRWYLAIRVDAFAGYMKFSSVSI